MRVWRASHLTCYAGGTIRERTLRFRKLPVIVDALRWDGSIASGEAIAGTFGSAVSLHAEANDPRPPRLACSTLEGVITASPGDWIIRGVAGEVYPCKPDIFAATYTPAELTRA